MARVSKDVEQAATAAMQAAIGKRKTLTQIYKNEKKVDLYLSPTYQPYFGKVMRVMINGVRIDFPVNGTTHSIPETFADEITARRKKIDEIISKQTRMANVPINVDSAVPGDLKLF